MPGPTIDRDDPAGRAQLAVDGFARRQRGVRVTGALALFAVAGSAPFLAAVISDPAPMFGTILASLLCCGCGVAVWSWTWSDAEHAHHAMAAIWAQARPTAEADVPWTRYGAWANAGDQHVELALISRAGTAAVEATPSRFTMTVKHRLDPDAVGDAAVAMEALRDEAAELEARAYEQHLEAVAAAARKPYDDALRAVDEATEEHQRDAEGQMRRELAEQEAAKRRAQANAVARALRRP